MEIKEQILLSAYTTLHVGGVADYLIEVCDQDELRAALRFAKEHTTVPPLILGSGSNVLINDAGYRGVVIINKIKGRTYDESSSAVLLRVGAGEILDEVIAETVDKGLWGLENLSAIPGTVGATPVQNVGAYGVEVASLVTEMRALHRDTFEEKTFSPVACQFGYRDSFFKTAAGRGWIITSVTFALSSQFRPVVSYADLAHLAGDQTLTPQIIRKTVQAVRAQKFPDWHQVGTAGSFFKNPIIKKAHYKDLLVEYPNLPGFEINEDSVKVSLGYILDKICGMRGHCENGVCLYEKQALVLTADQDTAAENIKAFVEKITTVVFEKTKISIEPEVLFV